MIESEPTGPGPDGSRPVESSPVDSRPVATAVSGDLLPADERDKFALRLRSAVNAFVDGPRESVQDMDAVFHELADRLTSVLAQRGNALRGTSDRADGDGATEALRVAMRDYRDLTERLLRL